MDDVIIIILTLVLTVVAAINQMKKKKQQAPTGNEGEPDFWEEILQGQKPAPQPVPSAPQPTRNEPVARKTIPEPSKSRHFSTKKAKSQVSQAYQTELFEEGGRNEDIMSRTMADSGLMTNATDQPKQGLLFEDFSLRKAIIYSEIIKPKYF